jgi:hypothetical protein
MQSLSAELKQVIIRRVEKAPSSEILEIASQLCSNEEAPVFEFSSGGTAPRFAAIDGMVGDNQKDLLWSANDIGERHDWAAAQKAVAKLDLGGFTDWRLPTIQELLTLVDYGRSSPAIDPIFSTLQIGLVLDVDTVCVVARRLRVERLFLLRPFALLPPGLQGPGARRPLPSVIVILLLNRKGTP